MKVLVLRYLSRVSVVGLFVLVMAGLSPPSSAQLGISITFYTSYAPPLLPVYDQPYIPGPGYIWTPGYWAWDDYEEDFYWVPGTWVRPPRVGYLWTPGYWMWSSGSYRWSHGYWGPTVGFYGGIFYGYGYTGYGYDGGYWEGERFYYNRHVNNIPQASNIQYTYTKIVNNNLTINNYSFNGPNGVSAQPNPSQDAAAQGGRIDPIEQQIRHEERAKGNRELRAAVNKGKPPIAATPMPAEFSKEVIPAKDAAVYTPPKASVSKPAPKKQESMREAQPAPKKHDNMREAQPAPKKQESMREAQPAPKKQESMREAQPAPKKQESMREAQPAPKKQESMREAQPAPKKQESMGEAQPAPKKHDNMREAQPAPKKQESRQGPASPAKSKKNQEKPDRQ